MCLLFLHSFKCTEMIDSMNYGSTVGADSKLKFNDMYNECRKKFNTELQKRNATSALRPAVVVVSHKVKLFL